MVCHRYLSHPSHQRPKNLRASRAEFATLAAEQEVAHVGAEGASDVAAALGQSTGETAAVERAEGVGAEEE